MREGGNERLEEFRNFAVGLSLTLAFPHSHYPSFPAPAIACPAIQPVVHAD